MLEPVAHLTIERRRAGIEVHRTDKARSTVYGKRLGMQAGHARPEQGVTLVSGIGPGFEQADAGKGLVSCVSFD